MGCVELPEMVGLHGLICFLFTSGSHPQYKFAERKVEMDKTLMDAQPGNPGDGEQAPGADSQPADKGGQGQTVTSVESLQEPSVKTEEPKGQDSTTGQKPYNEEPAWKERMGEIETKYGSKAKNWDAMNEIAANDPEFALQIVKKMEDTGRAPKGSYEQAKAQLKVKGSKDVKQQQKTEDPETENVQQMIDSHPAVQFAKAQQEQAESTRKEEETKTEGFLQDFEKKRPDIAASTNPLLTRQQIMMEAQRLAQEKKVPYQECMDEAYKWTLHRDQTIKEAQANGRAEGLAKNVMENQIAPSGGSAPSGGTRALTDEEEAARKLTGMSAEDYLKYSEVSRVLLKMLNL